jgi:hypothetical protein
MRESKAVDRFVDGATFRIRCRCDERQNLYIATMSEDSSGRSSVAMNSDATMAIVDVANEFVRLFGKEVRAGLHLFGKST